MRVFAKMNEMAQKKNQRRGEEIRQTSFVTDDNEFKIIFNY